MRPLLNDDEREFLLSICHEYTYDAVVDLMNEKFGKAWTKLQIRKYLKRNGIKISRSNKNKKGYVPKIKLLTSEELEYFLTIHKGRNIAETADMLNKRFNKSITENQMKSFFKNNKFNCDVNMQFKKGNIAWNKGKRFPGQINSGSFKKGMIPANHKPVGSERIDDEGYTMIKIGEPRKWRMKHIHIWEQANGQVPKGYSVMFLDQNKQNFNLDNLKLVHRAELLKFNQQGATNNAEVNKSKLLIAKVQLKLGKIKRSSKKSGVADE